MRERSRILSIFLDNLKIVQVLLIYLLGSVVSSAEDNPALWPITPRTFEFSLGKYSDWNERAELTEECALDSLDCLLDEDEHRVVGDNTSTAATRSELRQLTFKFGIECLDKSAVFINIGKYVYPDEGEFQGPLHNHFVSEANRCWDHYDDIYEEVGN